MTGRPAAILAGCEVQCEKPMNRKTVQRVGDQRRQRVRVHGASAPQVKAAAKRRLDAAADVLVQRLLGFALDGDTPDNIALAAIRDALDRAGLVAPKTLDVRSAPGPTRRCSIPSPQPHAQSRGHNVAANLNLNLVRSHPPKAHCRRRRTPRSPQRTRLMCG
jgi:hypothetical protein